MQADPAMTPQAADPAQAPQTADVSDAEVDQFASAAVEVQKIGSDTAVAEDAKQEKMAAAVQRPGLSADRFNQNAQAPQDDPALHAHIHSAPHSKKTPAAQTIKTYPHQQQKER